MFTKKRYSGILINKLDDSDFVYCIFHGERLCYYIGSHLYKSESTLKKMLSIGDYKILEGMELDKYLMTEELLK